MAAKNILIHPELDLPDLQALWQLDGRFSEHYLKTSIADSSWWPTDAETLPTWQFCKELYNQRAFFLQKHANEMGTRREFIDNVLETLGFARSDNLRLPETQQEMEPDYVLYPDQQTKEGVLDKSVAERYRAGVAMLD
ncbi:MAG: hypothetical protein WCH61_06710 [bacterium]